MNNATGFGLLKYAGIHFPGGGSQPIPNKIIPEEEIKNVRRRPWNYMSVLSNPDYPNDVGTLGTVMRGLGLGTLGAGAGGGAGALAYKALGKKLGRVRGGGVAGLAGLLAAHTVSGVAASRSLNNRNRDSHGAFYDLLTQALSGDALSRLHPGFLKRLYGEEGPLEQTRDGVRDFLNHFYESGGDRLVRGDNRIREIIRTQRG